MKYLQQIVCVLTILAIVFGGYFYIDNTYARGEQVQLVEQRLDIKILRDASRDYSKEISYIERQNHGKQMPVDDTMKIKDLREKKNSIDNELNLRLQELIRKN